MKKNILMMVVLSILALTSCTKKEDVVFSPYHIGQDYGGGIIFYIDCSGQHGLLVSPNDVPSGIPFTSKRVYPFFNPTRFGSGASNTFNIVNILKDNNGFFYAAKYLSVYGRGGRFDWYLPSKDELDIIYKNRNQIRWEINQFGNSVYWSSSNDSIGTNVWVQDFSNGKQTLANQLDTCAVRAIRNF